MVAVATDETALRLEATGMANFNQRQFGMVVYQEAGTTDADGCDVLRNAPVLLGAGGHGIGHVGAVGAQHFGQLVAAQAGAAQHFFVGQQRLQAAEELHLARQFVGGLFGLGTAGGFLGTLFGFFLAADAGHQLAVLLLQAAMVDHQQHAQGQQQHGHYQCRPGQRAGTALLGQGHALLLLQLVQAVKARQAVELGVRGSYLRAVSRLGIEAVAVGGFGIAPFGVQDVGQRTVVARHAGLVAPAAAVVGQQAQDAPGLGVVAHQALVAGQRILQLLLLRGVGIHLIIEQHRVAPGGGGGQVGTADEHLEAVHGVLHPQHGIDSDAFHHLPLADEGGQRVAQGQGIVEASPVLQDVDEVEATTGCQSGRTVADGSRHGLAVVAGGHRVLAVTQVALAKVEVGVYLTEGMMMVAGIVGHAAQGKDGIHVVAPHEQAVGAARPGGIEQRIVGLRLVVGYQPVGSTQEARLVARHLATRQRGGAEHVVEVGIAGGHGTLQSAPLHVEEGGRLDAVEHLHGQGVEGAVAEVAVLLLRPQAARGEQQDKGHEPGGRAALPQRGCMGVVHHFCIVFSPSPAVSSAKVRFFGQRPAFRCPEFFPFRLHGSEFHRQADGGQQSAALLLQAFHDVTLLEGGSFGILDDTGAHQHVLLAEYALRDVLQVEVDARRHVLDAELPQAVGRSALAGITVKRHVGVGHGLTREFVHYPAPDGEALCHQLQRQPHAKDGYKKNTRHISVNGFCITLFEGKDRKSHSTQD